MTKKDVDPVISAYFSAMSKRRKNPYLPFKDKVYAKKMALKAQAKRRAKKDDSGTPLLGV